MPMYNLIEYSNNYVKKHLEVCGNIKEMNKIMMV